MNHLGLKEDDLSSNPGATRSQRVLPNNKTHITWTVSTATTTKIGSRGS